MANQTKNVEHLLPTCMYVVGAFGLTSCSAIFELYSDGTVVQFPNLDLLPGTPWAPRCLQRAESTPTRESGRPVNRFNHTSWVAIVMQTDRPMSIRNRCVIDVFGGVFVLSRCFFFIFCGCRGFCHTTEPDIFLFLLCITFLFFNYSVLLCKYELTDRTNGHCIIV